MSERLFAAVFVLAVAVVVSLMHYAQDRGWTVVAAVVGVPALWGLVVFLRTRLNQKTV